MYFLAHIQQQVLTSCCCASSLCNLINGSCAGIHSDEAHDELSCSEMLVEHVSTMHGRTCNSHLKRASYTHLKGLRYGNAVAKQQPARNRSF